MLVSAVIHQEAKEAYYGGALWSLVQYASMGKSTFPSWSEVFQEERKEEEETAEEIMAKIVRDLKG